MSLKGKKKLLTNENTDTLEVRVLGKHPIHKSIHCFPVMFLVFSKLHVLSGDIALRPILTESKMYLIKDSFNKWKKKRTKKPQNNKHHS